MMKRNVVVLLVFSLVYCCFASVKEHRLSGSALTRRANKPVTNEKLFENPVLAYVTPWHSDGERVAVKYCEKFSHVSPTWYTVDSRNGKFVLTGFPSERLFRDSGWIGRLRSTCANNSRNLLVPRFFLNPETIWIEDCTPERMRSLARTIATETKRRGYDGLVIDASSLAVRSGFIPKVYPPFLESLRSSLRLTVIVVLPVFPSGHVEVPPVNSSLVDFFSLNSYDFPTFDGSPVPNSPLWWNRKALEYVRSRSNIRVFLGLNLFGAKYDASGRAAVVGSEVLDFLRRNAGSAITWDEESAEHRIYDAATRSTIYYPTKASIAARLQLARELDGGIALWEIGQGMEYLFGVM